jgi:hypothetical protein
MVLLAGVSGLILCGCALAALRSLRTKNTQKVRTLTLK